MRPPVRRALVVAAVLLPLVGCSSTQTNPTSSAHATTTVPATTTSSSTSTTVDPGTLAQTRQLPTASDPLFQARMADLWSAIVSGQPSLAAPAFFPLSAYVQVKGITDPVHDYQTRLLADFDRDIAALHSQIGASASFESVTVPGNAQWILPGVEYNKGSYWRVYGTRVNYAVGGQPRYFTVASMISWRGEWYVVHLSSIR